MPHIWIEASSNIKAEAEIGALKQCVYEAALATGIFPLGGIRVRFQLIDDYIVGDAHPDNSFVHVVLRIGVGRDPETKRKSAEAVFARICDLLAPLQQRRPLAVAFELQEMHPELNFKFNNLHEHIKRRQESN